MRGPVRWDGTRLLKSPNDAAVSRRRLSIGVIVRVRVAAHVDTHRRPSVSRQHQPTHPASRSVVPGIGVAVAAATEAAHAEVPVCEMRRTEMRSEVCRPEGRPEAGNAETGAAETGAAETATAETGGSEAAAAEAAATAEMTAAAAPSAASSSSPPPRAEATSDASATNASSANAATMASEQPRHRCTSVDDRATASRPLGRAPKVNMRGRRLILRQITRGPSTWRGPHCAADDQIVAMNHFGAAAETENRRDIGGRAAPDLLRVIGVIGA